MKLAMCRPWFSAVPLVGISSGCSLEGLMLKLKLQYFGHLMRRADFIWKDPDAGKDWGQEEKRMMEDEMVGWHHRLSGHEFGRTPGVGDGQAGLACCGSWGRKELDTAEQLNWTGGFLTASPLLSSGSRSALWSSGKVVEAGVLPTRNGGQKPSMPESPNRAPLSFTDHCCLLTNEGYHFHFNK